MQIYITAVGVGGGGAQRSRFYDGKYQYGRTVQRLTFEFRLAPQLRLEEPSAMPAAKPSGWRRGRSRA